MLPNFIVAGAPKSGTTSMYHYLSCHPDIFLPFRKEILFFDSSYYKGISWYENIFKGYNSEKVIGDISPNYMHNPYVPKRIFNTIPSAKIIFILRNPVERAYSHYWDLIGWTKTKESFMDMLNNPKMLKRGHSYIEFDILEMGFYYKHITRFLKYFPMNQIGIFLFDDLLLNKSRFINDIYKSLGVSSKTFEKSTTIKKYHTRRTNRSKLIGDILVNERLRKMVNIFPAITYKSARKMYNWMLTMNTKKINSRPISRPEIDYLLKMYRDDITSLQKLTSRSLEQWLIYSKNTKDDLE